MLREKQAESRTRRGDTPNVRRGWFIRNGPLSRAVAACRAALAAIVVGVIALAANHYLS